MKSSGHRRGKRSEESGRRRSGAHIRLGAPAANPAWADGSGRRDSGNGADESRRHGARVVVVASTHPGREASRVPNDRRNDHAKEGRGPSHGITSPSAGCFTENEQPPIHNLGDSPAYRPHAPSSLHTSSPHAVTAVLPARPHGGSDGALPLGNSRKTSTARDALARCVGYGHAQALRSGVTRVFSGAWRTRDGTRGGSDQRGRMHAAAEVGRERPRADREGRRHESFEQEHPTGR